MVIFNIRCHCHYFKHILPMYWLCLSFWSWLQRQNSAHSPSHGGISLKRTPLWWYQIIRTILILLWVKIMCIAVVSLRVELTSFFSCEKLSLFTFLNICVVNWYRKKWNDEPERDVQESSFAVEPFCHAGCVSHQHIMCWSLSAIPSPLGYSMARVKLGDYYYYGLGTEKNLEEAVDQYRMAADRMANPQAMFNLGYMYELGIGLQQVSGFLGSLQCVCVCVAKRADFIQREYLSMDRDSNDESCVWMCPSYVGSSSQGYTP